jgi:hypothetical protein
MTDDNKLNDGEVAIKLNGKDCVLKPTLGAAQAVNRFFGNFTKAYQIVSDNDFDAISFVIAQGLGRDPKKVAEDVFNTGFLDLKPHAVMYLVSLSNGGKSPKKDEPEADAGNGE